MTRMTVKAGSLRRVSEKLSRSPRNSERGTVERATVWLPMDTAHVQVQYCQCDLKKESTALTDTHSHYELPATHPLLHALHLTHLIIQAF